jgi:hypothetical protein
MIATFALAVLALTLTASAALAAPAEDHGDRVLQAAQARSQAAVELARAGERTLTTAVAEDQNDRLLRSRQTGDSAIQLARAGERNLAPASESAVQLVRAGERNLAPTSAPAATQPATSPNGFTVSPLGFLAAVFGGIVAGTMLALVNRRRHHHRPAI